MIKITTVGRVTMLLGRWQARTGRRSSLRALAQRADVPKDFLYRLDAGLARYIELDALGRLCAALECRPDEILIVDESDDGQP